MSFEDLKPAIDGHISAINRLISGFSVEGHICAAKDMIWKRKNIFELGCRSSNVLEIGFNAGHSAMHFLVSNPNLSLTCFDLGEHPYVDICFNYLISQFGNRIQLIKGDSSKTIPRYIEENPNKKFDCLHIDGCHDPVIASLDIENCYHLASSDSWVVFDDTDHKPLADLWESFIRQGKVTPVDLYESGLFPTLRWHHGIGKYVFLDWKWYISYYKDLPAAGILTEEAARRHWINYGMYEGRLSKGI